jgi:hypothetical protein
MVHRLGLAAEYVKFHDMVVAELFPCMGEPSGVPRFVLMYLLVIPAVNNSATIDQQPCIVKVPFGGRKMKRSRAIFIMCIHIGPAIYQEPCEVEISIP